MISITNTSPHLVAYNTGTAPWVSSNPNNAFQGQMRFVNNRIEVFDGASWLAMHDNITVGMSATAESALSWAMERQAQEKRWAELAEQHPAVADALAARDQAEAALSVVAKLCGELET
jgi:DNA-binding GntR family transcriptional regulator